jgi:hypothetical protein
MRKNPREARLPGGESQQVCMYVSTYVCMHTVTSVRVAGDIHVYTRVCACAFLDQQSSHRTNICVRVFVGMHILTRLVLPTTMLYANMNEYMDTYVNSHKLIKASNT